MAGLRESGSRSAFVGVLLIGALVTTGVLAWQAHRAVTYHQRAAADVLRDYAALAADEFIRQSASRLGYDGFYVLATATAEALEADGRLDQAALSLANSTDERLVEARPLARAMFVAHPSGVEVLGLGEHPPERGWLSFAVESLPRADGPFSVSHLLKGDLPRTIVTFAHPVDGRAGFLVNLEAVGAFVEPVMSEPLLPSSLSQGEITNEPLFVRLLDHGGVERFRSAGEPYDAFTIRREFGDHYEGVLEGFVVEVSLDPDAAAALVIGGVPPSRLPMLASLFGLSVVLFSVAMIQLRKERRLHELRTEFVASTSHELRTPLAQIRLYADTLLLDRARSEAEKRRSLEIVAREASRLSHLVDNLLRFSRSGRGDNEAGAVSVSLSETVKEVIERFEPLLETSESRITSRIEPDVFVDVDPDALQQVVLNLLDNAVKYGPKRQEIQVRVLRDAPDGAPRLVVEDQGPGVPARWRERIFDRFYRLDRDRASTTTGTGVGLAVVTEIVSGASGRAFVEPAADRGSRFVIELPPSQRGPAP